MSWISTLFVQCLSRRFVQDCLIDAWFFPNGCFLYTNWMMSWTFTRWWFQSFKYFLFSSLQNGKIPILTNIFQWGWNHQLELEGCPFNKHMSCLQENLSHNSCTAPSIGRNPHRSCLYDFMCFQTHYGSMRLVYIYPITDIWLILMVNVDISYHAWILFFSVGQRSQ